MAQEWAVFSSTNYSFETHESQTVMNLMNLSSGEVSLLYNGSEISELVWIGPTATSVLYVNGTNDEEDGGISLYAGDVTAIDEAYVTRKSRRWSLTDSEVVTFLARYQHPTLASKQYKQPTVTFTS